MGKQLKQWQILFSGAPKSPQMVTPALKLKDALWKKIYAQPRQYIKKHKHYFGNKGPSSQGYGFSSSHVCMWELDHKEIWAPKNWCFWTVLVEDSWESFGKQGDKASKSSRKSVLNIHWKDWCWSWTPVLWPPILWQRTDSLEKPWCWERLKAGGEGDERGWNGWMASLTQWTWVWASSEC